MREPWERLTGESAKAYASFVLYRDMGPERSLRKLAREDECRAKVGQLERWSSKWRWVERCQKYEDHLEHQDRLQQEKERREMHKRHAKMGMLAQTLALRKLEKALNRIEQDEDGISAPDAARILDVGVKVERQARGESTESHELAGPGGGALELKVTTKEQRFEEVVRWLIEMGHSKTEAQELAEKLVK